MAAQDFRVKNGLIVGNDVTLSTANAGGVLSWNNDESTLDVTLNSNVTLQVGQEQVFYGKATEAIANGDIVMFAGAQGDHLLIAKADMSATGFQPEYVIGVATQAFNTNDFGFVTQFGKVRGLDTDTLVEGTIIYLDPTTPGGWVTTAPTDGSHVIQLAAVTYEHAIQGTILVRPLHKDHLDELQGVNISSLTNGQILIWDNANTEWVNSDLPATYGDSDVGTYLSTNGYDTAANIKADLVDSAPATLDTLNELAAALGDDANFSTTITTSIGTKWTQDNTKISNWDTAYGWGDHGTAGYLTSIDLTGESIGELSDVDITTSAPTDGQALVWDNANSKFVPGDVTASFLGLTDTASSFGTAGQAVIVNGTADGLVFGDVTADFIGLTDSPSSYTGNGDRVVKVNSGATGLEFGDLVAGSNVRETYTGDGSTTDFTTTATFHGQNDLLVFVDGVIQYPGADFTLSGTTLTFLSAPTNGAEILLYGLTPITSVVTPGDGTVTAAKLAASAYTRDTFSGNNSTTSFTLTRDPGTVYSPFIYVDGVIQDPITHYTISGTTLTFTFTPATGTDNILVVYGPTNVAGTVSDGAITFAKLAPGNFSSQIETGDGTTTVFNLDQQAVSEDHIIVTVAGVPQSPDGTTYTVTNNGNDITFSTAPSNGAKIVIRYYATATYNVPVDNSVTSAKIADGAVGTTKLADSAVTNIKIADSSVTPAKLDREYATKGTSIALSIALG